jgi:ribonuclease P protein subunit RPR2
MHYIHLRQNIYIQKPSPIPMARGRRGRRTKEMVRIAGERIDILFTLAEEEASSKNLIRANRYVDLARRIGMRYNVRIPGNYKRRFCRHCHSYLVPGANSRVRLRGGKITVYCENCQEYSRIPIKEERMG